MTTTPSDRLLAALPAPPAGRTGWPWTVQTAAPPDAGAVHWPRITIVTPSYLQAAYVEETLRSVLLQNYPNLEFLVLDGGSTDGSAAIIERYAPHLAYWHSRADRGQGDAINQGFDRATGDILGWLNSDDFLLPGALLAVARAFLGGDADIVYGDALNYFEEDGSLQYWQGHWVRPGFLQFGGLLSSHATFWRRAVHVPLWAELNCNVDGELWQRLVPGRRLRYLPLPLGVFRAHAETKSNAERWREKWRQDDEKIWARHGRPTRSRVFRHWFSKSQRVYKWFTWRQNVPAKRAVLAACDWPPRTWRGPRP
jgi:glycosyltransferase involved in cell wall biosynthesis